jgi:hypothetical protein
MLWRAYLELPEGLGHELLRLTALDAEETK